MINFLRILFSALFIWIVYTIVATSLESNLFEEWSYLASIPWMRATLVDFYINEIIIFLWVCYREKSIFSMILWAVLFFCLGSAATTFYVLIILFKANTKTSIEAIILGENYVKQNN